MRIIHTIDEELYSDNDSNSDSDSYSGLMPQILALISPPSSDASSDQESMEAHGQLEIDGQHRHARGDQVICCVKCATQHYRQCFVEDGEPSGSWVCRACKNEPTESKDENHLDDSEEANAPEMLGNASELQDPYLHRKNGRYKPGIPITDAAKDLKKAKEIKMCFACSRGMRAGQLVDCDYCSLSYHWDCLDPPLAAPPLVMWMCPNHAEQFLNVNVLSDSQIERAKLWAVAAKDIDHEALKLEFMRKVSRKNPPFRYKVKKPERACAVIPPAVTDLYQNPITLVPSLPNNIKVNRTTIVNEAPTTDEINLWLSSVIDMHISCAWDLSIKSNNTSQKEDPEMVEEMMEKMFCSEKKLNRAAIDSFIAELETGTNITSKAHVEKMNPRLIKILATQRLQQMYPQFNGNKYIPMSQMPNAPDINFKIKENCPPNDAYAAFVENAFIKNGVILLKKQYVAVKDINGELQRQECKEEIRNQRSDEKFEELGVKSVARAALAPIGSLLRIAPVTMRLKTLTIGTSPNADVCLSGFGQCQFTSPNHAKIFYDTITGEYELLNYSPHGTVVDGCLYSLDGTQLRVPSVPDAVPNSDKLSLSIRAILDKRRGIKRASETAASIRVARAPTKCVCGCVDRLSDRSGWEGSAILQHCSHLQFGCLQFVFSIVDFAPSKRINTEEKD